MTSSANDEWTHYELIMAIHLIEKEILALKRGALKYGSNSLDAKSLQHAVDFIKWNMEQSEIVGGNGD